jgi:hypothetical protein
VRCSGPALQDAVIKRIYASPGLQCITFYLMPFRLYFPFNVMFFQPIVTFNIFLSTLTPIQHFVHRCLFYGGRFFLPGAFFLLGNPLWTKTHKHTHTHTHTPLLIHPRLLYTHYLFAITVEGGPRK